MWICVNIIPLPITLVRACTPFCSYKLLVHGQSTTKCLYLEDTFTTNWLTQRHKNLFKCMLIFFDPFCSNTYSHIFNPRCHKNCIFFAFCSKLLGTHFVVSFRILPEEKKAKNGCKSHRFFVPKKSVGWNMNRPQSHSRKTLHLLQNDLGKTWHLLQNDLPKIFILTSSPK